MCNISQTFCTLSDLNALSIFELQAVYHGFLLAHAPSPSLHLGSGP